MANAYAGLQLVNKEKKAIFSLWYSEEAEAYDGFVVSDVKEDGDAKRILGPYDWQINEPYRFRLEFEKSDIILNIDDRNNTVRKIGRQTFPNKFTLKNLSSKIDLFLEWFGPNEPTKPVEAVFSDFSPRPKTLIIEEDNTLNSYMDISDNRGVFVLK